MDLRWSNDGVAMEYLRRKNEQTPKFLARIITCFKGEKTRKREKKNPTPSKNSREIDGDVGNVLAPIIAIETIVITLLLRQVYIAYMHQQ